MEGVSPSTRTHTTLSTYLDDFRKGLDNSKDGNASTTPEVMEELEMRIADLFRERLKGREVVDIDIVNGVISQLGMPDWKEDNGTRSDNDQYRHTTVRKFYRDMDDKVIGGVCSGLALYLNVDVAIMRIFFVIALLFGAGILDLPDILHYSPGSENRGREMRAGGYPRDGRKHQTVLKHTIKGYHHGKQYNRKQQGTDEERYPGIQHPPCPRHRRRIRLVNNTETQGCEYHSGGRYTVPASHQAEEPRAAHLPLGRIPQGMPRKYYMITDKGRDQLRELDATWEELVRSVETIKSAKSTITNIVTI